MTAVRASGALGPGDASEHLAAIVESSEDAILSKDRDGVITSWNPAAERIYGYRADEVIGRPISILIPKHRAGEERRILARVLKGEHVAHYETERVTKDDHVIMVSLTISPIQDADGMVVAASVIARDTTGRHRTLRLASRLQDLTSELSREATEERVNAVVLSQIVGALGAQAGAVALVEGDDVVIAGSVGYTAEGLQDWTRFSLETDVPMTRAIDTGEAVWLRSAEELTEQFPALRGADVRFPALAVLPLAAGEAPFGAISLSFAERAEFDAEERAFLAAATQQAAYALARARMYEAERIAGERQGLLAEAGELLARSLDPETALRQLASLAVRHIADWCGVELVDEGGRLRNVAVAHVDQTQVRRAERLRERYPTDPRSETGAPNVIRTGVSELYPEVTDEMLVAGAQDEEHLRMLRELGLGSAMVVPLRARGRVFGAITLVASGSGRTYGEVDLTLAEDLARRAALAVDNAMLFRREHEAAILLQRSLLPQSLPPEHQGLRFDARYRPAAPGLEVGGDWYEVVVLDDGTVGLTIGDVAGRGIRAASVMGHVRPALRAYVLDGHGPRDAIARLDRLMKEHDDPEMTTAFHLHYEPETRRARYVRAGHPPGLIRLPDGEVVELRGAGTPPLGVLEEVAYREHEVEVPPESLVVLYTDGLIERRGTTLNEELARLKDVLADAPNDARESLEWIESRVVTDAIPDDVAMLAMSTPA